MIRFLLMHNNVQIINRQLLDFGMCCIEVRERTAATIYTQEK